MVKLLKNKQNIFKDQRKEQTEIIKEQGEKQIKATEFNRGADNKWYIIFDELSYERMTEIKYLSRQIDLNNLIYYFKNKDTSPTNFIGVKGPLHICRDISDDNIELAEAEKGFKWNNKRKSSKNQKIKQNELKIFMNQEGKLLNYMMILLKLDLKLNANQNMVQDLKY